MNPLDEYLNSRPAPEEKRAAGQTSFPFMARQAMGEAARSVGRGAMQGAGALAGVALAGAAGQAYGAITKRKDFRAMLDAAEDVRHMHTQDPEQVNKYYDSARRVLPQFMSDPYVAAHVIRSMSENVVGPGQALLSFQQQQRPKSGGPSFELKLDGRGPSFGFKT